MAGLLLAAGGGRRFGGPKALVEHRGQLFVEAAAAALAGGGCAPVVVVLGASAAEVRERADLSDAVLVDNPEWVSGMGSSLRAGLAVLADAPVDAVLVLPVDTPGVTAAAVRRVAAHTSPDALVRASYKGRPGHPVLIGRAHWAGVAELAVGDAGARDYLRRNPVLDVPCADVASGEDVDRPEDLPS
ncbi:NTP transferase domain-containing protein [Solihabitans fulvus]|uniref:NTP transferase domain-containing protein n=1 Tax=Solihabitans fulvus TaxID=1892852 RepID=A0A5B2WR62_9PSEU|nr:NTP transferase domain-containing protein [Solihabitans fulvus]